MNKYKEIISKNIEEILKEQKGLKLQKFIEDGVNSKYSEGICKYLGHDFNEQFYNEISRKTNIELNYQPYIFFQYENSNPFQKEFVPVSDLYKVKNITVGRINELISKRVNDGKGIQRDQLKKTIDFKDNKI